LESEHANKLVLFCFDFWQLEDNEDNIGEE